MDTPQPPEGDAREALRELYELCREDGFGKGWKRGQQALRNAEIALGYIPRLSPYSWDTRLQNHTCKESA